MSYGGKSSSGSKPAANGYQPTQPAQQKFTSQIAQPLQHAAPSAATAQLSGALAGSPSWMTPPAAHTPFQLPANLPGIQHPAIQNPGLSGSIFNGSKPVNIAQTMAPTPKPAPAPVQAQPMTLADYRLQQAGVAPGTQAQPMTQAQLAALPQQTYTATPIRAPGPAPQPINQIAQPPQQGTTNPQPTAPAPGGGMTALAPGNLPPPAAQSPLTAPGNQGLYDSNGQFLGAPVAENLSNQPTYTASPIRAPGPAPTPTYQGPGTAQWNPATQTWDRTDQSSTTAPGSLSSPGYQDQFQGNPNIVETGLYPLRGGPARISL